MSDTATSENIKFEAPASDAITLDRLELFEIKDVIAREQAASAAHEAVLKQLQAAQQAVIALAQRDPAVVAAQEERATLLSGIEEKYGINFASGQINLETGEFFPAEPQVQSA